MLSSVSHDLKTPLAAIRTAVTSLRDGAITWSSQDEALFLETIDAQSARLQHVISDMLDLTRIEAGALHPIVKPIALADLVEDALEQAAPVLADHHVERDVELGLDAACDEVLTIQAL